MNPQAPTLKDLYFSPHGRINRAKYWLYILLLDLFQWTIVLLGAWAAGGGDAAFLVLFYVGAVICFWPGLCLNIKRCHDRGRSGLFILVMLVPIVQIWYLVEILFLAGTQGDNKYGPDPLAVSEALPG